jgi:hypothetical protein
MRSLESYENHLKYKVAQCAKKWLVLRTSSLFGVEYVIAPHACKSNYCPRCRKNNLIKLRKALYSALKTHTWRLVTLTYPDHSRDLLTQLRSIYKQFHCFIRRVKRVYPNLAYVRTIEIHQRGYPHIHLIVDKYIPIAFLTKHWHDVGGGLVDIRRPLSKQSRGKRVTYKQAARYLTEEIEKSSQDPHRLGPIFWQSRVKAVSSSRNLSLKSSNKSYEFVGVYDNIDLAMVHYENLLFDYKYNNAPKPSIHQGDNCFIVGYGLDNNLPIHT